ncbi:MAG: helix-turn-helix domain-containing protein, partial [Desulfobacterales bacterium]
MGAKKSPQTPAINRAVDVIELMAASDTALSLSELMRQLDIPRQSLIRILNTLCDRGILNRSP